MKKPARLAVAVAISTAVLVAGATVAPAQDAAPLQTGTREQRRDAAMTLHRQVRAGGDEGQRAFAALAAALASQDDLARRAASRVLVFEPLRVGEMRAAMERGARSRDPVIALRCQATLVLAELSTEGGHDALRRRLVSPDAADRSDAAAALRRLRKGAAPAVPELVWALGDPDRHVYERAAGALEDIGPGARPAIPALITLYEVTSGSYSVPQALDAIRHGLREATPLLLAEARHRSASVRAAVIERLGRNGPAGEEVVAAVREALSTTDPGQRSAAIGALARVAPEDPQTVETLREFLTYETPRARRVAVNALAELGDGARAAVPDVARLVTEDPAPEVRLSAVRALRRIGRSPDDAVAALVRALMDADARVLRAAVQALTVLGPPADAASRLRELETSEVYGLPEWALAARWRAQPELADDVPTLFRIARLYGELEPYGDQARARLLDLARSRDAPVAEILDAWDDAHEDGRPVKLTHVHYEVTRALGPHAATDENLAALVEAASGPAEPRAVLALDVLRRMGRAALPVAPEMATLIAGEGPRMPQAATVIGAIGPEAAGAALDVMLAVIDGPPGESAEPVADALGQMGPGALDPLLDRSLRNLEESAETRRLALRALGGLGELARPAVPLMVVRATAGDLECVQALGGIGPTAEGAVPVLRELLARNDAELASYELPVGFGSVSFWGGGIDESARANLTRAVVARALGRIGRVAFHGPDTLRPLMKSDDPHLRLRAAQAALQISQTANDPALQVITDLVADDAQHWALRFHAIEALRELGPAALDAAPVVDAVGRDDTADSSLRVAAGSALRAMWGQ